jgi:hypothetical protein
MDKTEIKNTILKFSKVEQTLRKSIFKPGYKPTGAELNKLRELDEKSTEYMNKVVKEFGLPTIFLVGKKASLYAWLLVQHSKDLALQKSYLALLKNAEKGAVNPEHAAYLEDRILMHEGNPQIYGTQVLKNKVSGMWEPYTIASEDSVDKLRESAGLEPLGVYLKTFNL